MSGARHPGGPPHRLHLRLVPEVVCSADVHAVDAEVLAHLGELHLKLLEYADHPAYRPELTGQTPDRVDDLTGVEPVVDPPVTDQLIS